MPTVKENTKSNTESPSRGCRTPRATDRWRIGVDKFAEVLSVEQGIILVKEDRITATERHTQRWCAFPSAKHFYTHYFV